MHTINLNDKFELFSDHWNPRIIADLNGQHVKIAKIHGEFVWHDHTHEDELFYVIKGHLKMEFRDRVEEVRAGEMIVVPRGVEHKPSAEEETWIMLFEPSDIKHTGEVKSDLTVDSSERI